jgi:ankyrin repeat protein
VRRAHWIPAARRVQIEGLLGFRALVKVLVRQLLQTRATRGVGALVCAVLLSPTLLEASRDQRLIDAVRARDTGTVRALIRQRVPINADQGDGATALHWATYYDDVTLVDLLLQAGARSNVADDTGVTPLYIACGNRSARMVQRLLAAGANPNAALINGETVLMNCARTGEPNSIRDLLAAGAAVNAKESAHGQTALMWAAAEAHADAVGLLIESGGDVQARSRVYPQIVTGEQTQRAGREELNYTVLRGGSTPILFAARAGSAESIRLLVKAGANPNDSFPNGMSALVEAAHSGQTAAAVALLDAGADPNAAGAGYSALHAAILRGDVALAKALLAHGANPNLAVAKGTPIRRNTTDYYLPATLIGATPYLLAAKFLEPEIMEALIAAGADARITMKDGTTALMLAAGIGAVPNANRRGVENLDGGKMEDPSHLLPAVISALNHGAEVNATNQGGDTALHGAAAQGYDEVVQTLVSRGAKLDAINKRGLTALALARGANQTRNAAAAAARVAPGSPTHPSTVELLRKLGASES